MRNDVRLTRDNVAILVDSTADMPEFIAKDQNVSMIPLLVRFGAETYRDWIDITPSAFYPKLRAAKELPTTSLPSVGEFVAVYRDLRSRYDYVYSFHLSSKISGTFGAATVAAEQVDNVTVVDTGICSSGIALLVQRLLMRIEAGTTHQGTMDYIAWFQENLIMLFLLDTLEYIVKGGRVGNAAGLVGTLLNIKPILTFKDGLVTPFKKARGEKKAMQVISETVAERTRPDAPLHAAVAHAEVPDKAQEMIDAVRQTGRPVESSFITELGSVIGTYGGPRSRVLFVLQE